ncbi:MAG: YjjG family noncanonical pyrimidine nucleotidase [Acutalibacteraceae bacterium]|jgi:2-haloacid dehalogenase
MRYNGDQKGVRGVIRAVLIDIDNTLLDFHAGAKESMRRAFADTGLVFAEGMFAVFTAVNNDLWRQIERGAITRQELYATRFERVLAALGMTGDGPAVEERFRHYLSQSAVPVEGALALLAWLAERVEVAVASNGPYQQQLDRLEKAGMAPYITRYFISEEIGFQKPRREFFEKCLSRLGDPDPATVLMIGDSLTADIAGAAALGMPTCWYNPDGGDPTPDCRPDAVVDDLAAIPPLFGLA